MWVGILIGFFLAIAILVIANLDRFGKSRSASSRGTFRSSAAPAATTAPTVSPAVYRVAPQFVCTCGACGEKPLESCDCPTATEGRAFIQQQLAAGHSEAEAADALEAKYGGRKRAGTPNASDADLTAQMNAGTLGVGHLATAADRAHIISHFKCPCNQCAIDELSDCECPHPKGAQEVKQFIDDTIAQGQHTVGEIVALVEQRYGGRIR